MGSREELDCSSNQILVSSDLSTSNTIGVEREVIIENKEYPTEEHAKSRLLRRGRGTSVYKEWPKDMLSEQDWRIVGILEQLPQKLPIRNIKFKKGFFRIVVKLVGRLHFYDKNDNPKFPFYWTNNPLRPKDILSVQDRRIVGILEQLPESYMAQYAAKMGTDEDMFHKLRNKLVEEVNKALKTVVSNLKGLIVDTHRLLFGHAGSSGFRSKAFNLGGLEIPLVVIR
ncbi:hypothetical protein V8G54_028555 [Vigna mungo]|uniref:Uncharacterized protein n=1 Tax=Vigna mungo TaxID=3915 RepID=A0AAQ3MTJ6_VIGMU